MRWFKAILGIVALVAATMAFWGVPVLHLSLRIQPTLTISFLIAAAITLVFGRFFCLVLCPLGLLQGLANRLFHPRSHKRRVCTRLPETRMQRVVRWTVFAAVVVLAACGFWALAWTVTPYAIFGRFVAAMRLLSDEVPQGRAFFVLSVAFFGVVMLISAFGDGRFWCNWICPFGTVFNLLSKLSPFGNRVKPGCARCHKCFGPVRPEEATGIVSRREVLKGVAMLAVTEKLTDGGYADVSLPGVPDRENPILPPGAVSRAAFRRQCVGCQLCVANCPERVLKPSLRLSDFGQPEMDFRHGYCRTACVKCSEVCPAGALQRLQTEMRPNVHVGQAVWRSDLCVRTAAKEPCTACVRKCPVQAIHLVKDIPVVDGDACIGCGACEHVCPARPMPAIYVKGLVEQRVVNPMKKADLRAEKAHPVDGLFAYVKPGNF